MLRSMTSMKGSIPISSITTAARLRSFSTTFDGAFTRELQPEFRRKYCLGRWQPSHVSIHRSKGNGHSFARQWYWDLMNEVRTQPYVRRFEVTKWLKLSY